MAWQNEQRGGDRQGQARCCWCLWCRSHHLPISPYIEAAAHDTVAKRMFTLPLAFQQGMSDEQLPASPHHPATEGDANVSASGCPEHWVEPQFTQAARVRVIVTAIFFLLAVGSNVAVLGSLLRKRRKSHVRPLILSLALADLLVTVAVMPLDAAWNVTVQWYGGDLSCKFFNFLKLFAMYAAALVLVVISLDRHAAVLHPFSRARRRNGLLLRAAWASSVLLASPQVGLGAFLTWFAQAGVVLQQGFSMLAAPTSPSQSMGSTTPSLVLLSEAVLSLCWVLSAALHLPHSTHSLQCHQRVTLRAGKNCVHYNLHAHGYPLLKMHHWTTAKHIGVD